jgi:hypothetical protein
MTGISATWTDPKDWNSGETLLEADFDNYISSNLMFLKTPTQSRLTAGTLTTTTSASFVDITGVTITMTTNAYKCNIHFIASIACSTAGLVTTTLLIDGVNVGDATLGIQLGNYAGSSNLPFGFVFPTAVLTAGSHTFKMQWKTSAGTATLQTGWNFYAVER